jgi:hypothetical protein
MVFRSDSGITGRVISATASTIRLPTLASPRGYETFEVRIVRGTGVGQTRVVSSQAKADIADSGIVTAVSSTTSSSSITDSTKSWTINQWAGYTLRFTDSAATFPTAGNFRKILHNDATSLTYINIALNHRDAYPHFVSPTPQATAGAQSTYQIESTLCTVESNWTTTPDESSRFEAATGLITFVGSQSTVYSLATYSVAEDLWYYRNAYSGLLGTPTVTDISIENADEALSVLWNGKATAGTTTTLTDADANWVTNEWADRWLFIFSGQSEGTLVKIISNTQTTLTFAAITAPNSTSRYRIWSLDAGTVTTGNTNKTLTDSAAVFGTNRYAKAYQLRIVGGTGMGQVRRIMSNTDTVLTLDKDITTSTDSVYYIEPDASTYLIMFGGNTEIIKQGIDSSVACRGVEYDYGEIAGGTARYADNNPVSVLSGTVAAAVCTVTTTYPHGFKTGYSITHAGDTGASAVQNNITANINVTGATTYTYPATGSTASWTIAAQSTTTLKDASKNWTVNEHAGRLVSIAGATTVFQTPMANVAQIASNTANTLTFVSVITTPVVGAQYVICSRPPIGSLVDGLATGTQSTTTLQDTSKTWVVNLYAGRVVRFLGGAGTQAISVPIISNTSNTLTFGTTTAPVNGATPYSILSQRPRGAGFELTFPFNTSHVEDNCRYLYAPRGVGNATCLDRFDLTTGDHELVAIGQQFESLGIGSMYNYDGEDRIYFTKEATNRCYYLDLSDGQIYGAPQIPYVAGTAIIGNRMDIMTTVDRLKILFVNRHSNIEFFKTLLWY